MKMELRAGENKMGNKRIQQLSNRAASAFFVWVIFWPLQKKNRIIYFSRLCGENYPVSVNNACDWPNYSVTCLYEFCLFTTAVTAA